MGQDQQQISQLRQCRPLCAIFRQLFNYDKTIHFNIELDFTPQLEQKEISKFVLNASPTNYKSADPTETNFSLVATKPSGTNPMSLFANVKYYYNVFYKNVLVSNFSVIVPVEQKVILTIKSNLLIQDGLEQSIVDKIKTAFNNYDPNVGIDPTDYANLLDKFKIICSFELDKDGVFIEHKEQLNAILALYSDVNGFGTITSLSGSSKITGNNTLFLSEIYPGSIIRSTVGQQLGTVDKIASNTELILKQPASTSNNDASFLIDVLSKIYVLSETTISDYFKKGKYKIVQVKRELLDEFGKPEIDPIHEVESNDPSVIDAIVKNDSKGLDCGN